MLTSCNCWSESSQNSGTHSCCGTPGPAALLHFLEKVLAFWNVFFSLQCPGMFVRIQITIFRRLFQAKEGNYRYDYVLKAYLTHAIRNQRFVYLIIYHLYVSSTYFQNLKSKFAKLQNLYCQCNWSVREKSRGGVSLD